MKKYFATNVVAVLVATLLTACLGNDKKNNEVAALSAQQDQKIKDFLNSRNVPYQRTNKGTYVVIQTLGDGINVPKADSLTVELNYSLSVFEGALVRQNARLLYNPKFGAYLTTTSSGNQISQTKVEGIHDAAQLLRKGGRARAFIPGLMAFGAASPSINNFRIPSYGILIVDFWVKDVRSDAEQAMIERDSIRAYISRKGHRTAVEFPSGLWKMRILDIGDISSRRPSTKSTVTASYKLYNLADELYEEGGESSYELGENKLIAGFEEALTTMHIGEQAIFALPSRIAYKAKGSGSIPPYEILIYELKLYKIVK